jgi:putative transposase
VLCDENSVPLAIYVTGANVHDLNGLEEMLAGLQIERPEGIGRVNLCLDAGYIAPDTELIVANYGMVSHIRPRGEEKQEKQAGKKARRWTVERSHSWANRYRRLLIRWEKKRELYFGLLCLAAAITALSKLFPG